MVILKSPREIKRMRKACSIAYSILLKLSEIVAPGISLMELEEIALHETLKYNAKPAFKGYYGFPNALCCSLNDQVVHGMPNKVPLRSGDILSLDFGVLYDDFYGDSAVTIPVGSVTDSLNHLLNVTEQSLFVGIDRAFPGAHLGDVSSSIQNYVEENGYSVVRDFVGHGIGKNLHEDPQVPNFGIAGTGIKLKAGMVLAIEPMVNQFSHEVKILDDGWTVITCDGGMSAHFEHTVAITENGPEILTRV